MKISIGFLNGVLLGFGYHNGPGEFKLGVCLLIASVDLAVAKSGYGYDGDGNLVRR